MANGSKNEKTFLRCFDLVAAVCVVEWGKGYTLIQLFLRVLYLNDSISSVIFWINKLHCFHEEICFPNNGCIDNEKKEISQFS